MYNKIFKYYMRQNLQTFEELGKVFLDCVCKQFESLISKHIFESSHKKGKHSVLEKQAYIIARWLI